MLWDEHWDLLVPLVPSLPTLERHNGLLNKEEKMSTNYNTIIVHCVIDNIYHVDVYWIIHMSFM